MKTAFARPAVMLAALLTTALLAGCRQPDFHDHPHKDHKHEAKTAQITVWPDRYEVFAEQQVPAVDVPTTFITHVTDLKTLEPRSAGPVIFLLRQGDATLEHPQAGPAKPGIYLPRLTFPKPGKWGLTLLVPTDSTNATVEMGAVEVFADVHAAQHAELPDASEGVSFLKEQQWKIHSQAELVTKRRLVEGVHLGADSVAPRFSAHA